MTEKDDFQNRLHAAVDIADLETLKDDVEDAIADAEALLTTPPPPPPPPDPLRGEIQSLLTEMERLADELDAAGEPGEADDVRDRRDTFADDLSNATTTTELEDLRDDILVAIGDAEDVLGIDLDAEKEVVEELLEDVEDLVDDLDDAGMNTEADDLEDMLDDFEDALDDATSRHEVEDLTTEITTEIAEIEAMLSLEDDVEDAIDDLRDVADEYDAAGENSIAQRLHEDADEYEEELQDLVDDDEDREEFAYLLEDIVDDVDDARSALP
jgi:predicted  nucleic acid-binding Zn-ribbon protein